MAQAATRLEHLEPDYASRRPSAQLPKKAAPTGMAPGQVSFMWQRLRAARQYADLRQMDIANACGKNRATVALWESHQDSIRTRPTANDVNTYAAMCKVPVAMLMDDRVNPSDILTLPRGGAAMRVPTGEAPVLVNVAPVRNTLLGMEDRRAQTFWSAVEFEVVGRNPALASAFGIDGDPNFIRDDNAVVFASDTADAKQLLIGAMAILLQHEKTVGKTLAKHVLVFAGTGGAKINEREAEKLWGVSVRQVDNTKDAAKYLLAL